MFYRVPKTVVDRAAELRRLISEEGDDGRRGALKRSLEINDCVVRGILAENDRSGRSPRVYATAPQSEAWRLTGPGARPWYSVDCTRGVASRR